MELVLKALALIAVLPEYAVDFAFAAKAGQDPEKYAPLALANMTGGNRLLIGVGWIGFPAVNIQATSGISNDEQGLAAGVLQTSMQVGAAIVLAIASAITATSTTHATMSAKCTSGT